MPTGSQSSSPGRPPARTATQTPGTPSIRHAVTSDGLQIAFRPEGTGPWVVVLFPYHISDLTLSTLVPPHRRGLAHLATACTVVPVDLRGSGRSSRSCGPLSLEAFSHDLEAVREALGAARVAVCAVGSAALVACAYAARHGDRLSRLVCLQAGESEANRRLLAVRRASLGVEVRLRAQALAGTRGAGTVSALAAAARAALQPEQLAAWEALLSSTDLLALARAADVPALCVHATHDDLVTDDAAHAFVDALPRGRLHRFPGRTGLDVWDDLDTLDLIRTFLAEGREPTTACAAQRRPDLSERELAVLQLLAGGGTNRAIAAALGISVHTVSFHLRGIFGKTGASNRTEAAAYAHRRGLGG